MPPKPPKNYGGNIMSFFGGSNATQHQQNGGGLANNGSLASAGPSTKPQPAAAPTQPPKPTSTQHMTEAERAIAENAVRALQRQEREEQLLAELAAARREALAQDQANGRVLDPKLNPHQLQAATAPIDRPLMIVAGAGTGKTSTILQRIRHLCLYCDVHPASILLISFTVKAAKEAKDRLALLGLPGANHVKVGTFHSFCYYVLRGYFRLAGFERCPTVISENADLKRVLSVAMVRANVERFKNSLCEWLQVPMLETSWQGVVDEVKAKHPELYRKAAAEAAKWYEEKGITKKKKKKKAAAAKGKGGGAGGGGGRKRKNAAENTAASIVPTNAAVDGGSRSPFSSPKKQSKLNFGVAALGHGNKEAVAAEAAAAAAIEQASRQLEQKQEEAEEEEVDYATKAAAGVLGEMPRELQTSLFAHVYAALCRGFDPNLYRSLEYNVESSKKKVKDTVAASLLAKPPAKEVKAVLKDLGVVKRRGESYEDVQVPKLRRQYYFYQEELCSQNAVDFDDLLIHVRNILRERPFVAQKMRERYPYLVVDEWQDTNNIQLEITMALAPPNASPRITVVGDGDQSIYRFRGANPAVMHAFKTFYEHENLRHCLELNYRCSSHILEVAAASLAGNHRRDPEEKLLPTKTGPMDPVIVMQLRNPAAEARWIVEEIKVHLEQGVSPQEISVMFRNFKIFGGKAYDHLRKELESSGIPYRIVRETSLLQRAAVKDILAYADLLLNPDNDPAFLRVYNTPRRRLGPAVEQRLYAAQEDSFAAGQRLSLLECARRLAISGDLGPQQSRKLREFVDIIDELRGKLVFMRPPEVIDAIVDRTKYLEYLHEEAEKKRKKLAKDDADDVAADDTEILDLVENANRGGDEDEEDSDDDDNGEEEEESEDAVMGNDDDGAAGGGGGAETTYQWSYDFKCELSGPLRRLQQEAIKWVAESEPHLGLAADKVPESAFNSSTEEHFGPPSLETLCFRALSGPQCVQMLKQLVRDGVNNVCNTNMLEVVSAASCCGPVPLADFQSYLRLEQSEISADKQQLSSAELGVNISTIHAAKGLEWDVCFVPRFNEGFLPCQRVKEEDENEDGEEDAGPAAAAAAGGGGGNGGGLIEQAVGPDGQVKLSDDIEDLEEERRLAHVACTRARNKLYLSYVDFDDVEMAQKPSSILESILARCPNSVQVKRQNATS